MIQFKLMALRLIIMATAILLVACAEATLPSSVATPTLQATIAEEQALPASMPIASTSKPIRSPQATRNATPTSRLLTAPETAPPPTAGPVLDETQSSSTSGTAEEPPPPTTTKFTITLTLCDDEQGPKCTALRLGDDYLTTSQPAKGHLFSCSGKNPKAPGSVGSKLTWVNFADKTWNLLKKLWLPQGAFVPVKGTYTETTSGTDRQISVNNLPVDGKIGDWPMTNYSKLTAIDPNPGIPASQNLTFGYAASPSLAQSPACVSLGAIGVTKNGVVIYNAVDGRGEDAVAREIVDVFGGHPARTDYHYHFIPERLDDKPLSDGHSGIVGYINDGFPIYGYKGQGGIEMANDDLDQCHGHVHGELGYHYHATLEYPYTIGCYVGTPASNPANEVQGARGPRGRPPPQPPDTESLRRERQPVVAPE